ncbi:MAG: PDZ domain-containing protein [Acidobacteriota bacterium]
MSSREIADQSRLVSVNVGEGGAEEDAGMKQGDVIQEVNRTPVKDPAEFQRLVRSSKDALLLYVKRDGNGTYITVRPHQGYHSVDRQVM